MKRSQARIWDTPPEPAPKAKKKVLERLRRLFVKEVGAKEVARPRAPRPMPVPLRSHVRPRDVEPDPELPPDPILRSVVEALRPEDEAPNALREALVAWAEETAEPDTNAPPALVLEALAPRFAAPTPLRDALVAWAESTAEPPRALLLEPRTNPAPAPPPPASLWQSMKGRGLSLLEAGRRLAGILLDKLRKTPRDAR